jgi:Fic family protein
MAKLKINLEEVILEFLRSNASVSSKTIYDYCSNYAAYASVKRTLKDLVGKNLVGTIGKGKITKYIISPDFEIIVPRNLDHYFTKEIDERQIKESFNFSLIEERLVTINLFANAELLHLNGLEAQFTDRISKLTKQEFLKEFELLAIDLSWKSSQIEGNTYSLLETEKLLKEHQTASGKTKEEASMLLNHKEALDFIIENPDYLSTLNVARIENIHSILVKELGINRNIRNKRVGISGTNYKPLDNEFQIREALEKMCVLINLKENIFEKSLLALVLISYIQPFSDGNKRTARIISNAILMNYQYCPISFRTVDSIDYKKAMLLFYEQNNISAFKKIYIEQFEFAVNTYF